MSQKPIAYKSIVRLPRCAASSADRMIRRAHQVHTTLPGVKDGGTRKTEVSNHCALRHSILEMRRLPLGSICRMSTPQRSAVDTRWRSYPFSARPFVGRCDRTLKPEYRSLTVAARLEACKRKPSRDREGAIGLPTARARRPSAAAHDRPMRLRCTREIAGTAVFHDKFPPRLARWA